MRGDLVDVIYSKANPKNFFAAELANPLIMKHRAKSFLWVGIFLIGLGLLLISFISYFKK